MSPDLDRLAEIRARLEAATPGPWRTVTVSSTDSELAPRNLDEGLPHTDLYAQEVEVTAEVNEPGRWQGRADCRQVNVACLIGERRENRELIAHAPGDIAYLLAQVARLREALEHLEWSREKAGWTGRVACCPACFGVPVRNFLGYETEAGPQYEPVGHKDNCWLRAALAGGEP